LKSKEITLLRIPDVAFTEYVAYLNIWKIAPIRFAEYKEWLRYYPDFCDKYPAPTNKAERVRLFCENWTSDGVSEEGSGAKELERIKPDDYQGRG
jgi:hypothetical protein